MKTLLLAGLALTTAAFAVSHNTDMSSKQKMEEEAPLIKEKTTESTTTTTTKSKSTSAPKQKMESPAPKSLEMDKEDMNSMDSY